MTYQACLAVASGWWKVLAVIWATFHKTFFLFITLLSDKLECLSPTSTTSLVRYLLAILGPPFENTLG